MTSPSRLRAVRHNPELGRGRGKKAEKLIDGEYLDWELDNFSGYIAADELYDRPYCVLSIVDNRMFKQIERKIGYLFDYRHIFVQHHLTDAERGMLRWIKRGLS